LQINTYEGAAMKKHFPFSLVKWYLDCVTESGQALIGYAASLRWHKLTQDYSSTLFYTRNQISKTNSTLSYEAPTLLDDRIEWNAPSLNIRGIWLPLDKPIEHTLLQTPQGSIAWSCLVPRAYANISHSSEQLEGLGYIERLTLTTVPWELPFNELHWGRFLSEHHTLVWIDWRGGKPFSLIFYDGKECQATEVTDQRIVLKDEKTVLSLTGQQIIREGPLLTILSRIPGLDQVLPTKILRACERKWCSRGCLETPQA
jgi:hypothetical protein